ncbi:MAG: DUF1194 domain-containing protein [Patescibacteria group bacterium]
MRISFIRAMLIGIALVTMTTTAPATQPLRKEQVDLLLCLAADVSRSVNYERFQLQRNGYAAALVDKRVLQAISSGPLGRIGVVYIEWSGQVEQKTVVEWAIIDGFDSGQHFAEQLIEVPRPFTGMTAIGTAIESCLQALYEAPYDAERKTVDVSGDGANNDGREPADARNDAVREGVVVNGLPILTPLALSRHPNHTHPPGGLEEYFRVNVRGGPGSFVVVAEDHQSFAAAIVKKMIAEIAMR